MKKIGLLCMVLVLALGLMGAGLSYWTETLQIEGTVKTGELDACFIDYKAADNDAGDAADGYGEVSVKFYDGPDSEPAAAPIVDMSKCVITVKNAYPGYVATVALAIKNNGTLPAKVKAVTYSGDVAGECVFSAKLTTFVAGYVLPVGTTQTDTLQISIPTSAGNEVEKQIYNMEVLIDFCQENDPSAP
jgi:hypothetical protein